MSDLTLSFAEKLRPLVARLGSDYEGEQLACLAAIRRLLAARGLNFTDLATMLDQPERVRTLEVAQACWTPRTWGELAQWLVENDCGRLREKERSFVLTMARHLVLGGEPIERQADWLRGLYGRLGGAA